MSKAHPVSPPNSAGSPRHTIRLHGPWHVEPLACTKWGPNGESIDLLGDLPPAQTRKLPATWKDLLGAEFRGRVLCKRRFGQPTNLDVNERIDLVVQPIQGLVTMTLNGRPLAQTTDGETAYRFEVTDLLLPRNNLHIEINLPAGRDELVASGKVGEVYLEIYESTP